MRQNATDYEALLENHPITPYTDPVLKLGKRQYTRFVRKLHRIGMVSFTRLPENHIDISFVTKKSGSLGMIQDARRVDQYLFSDPPPVSLLTAEGLSRIEVQVADPDL